jgi:threonine dehydratase
MLHLLDTCFAGLNIADFQYGKTAQSDAWPIFTLQGDSNAVLDGVLTKLSAHGFEWHDLTGAVDVSFRSIPLRSNLLQHPAFLRLDFYERPGALHDFLARRIQGKASLCYFNYQQSGERIGRALIGLDFPSPDERDSLLRSIPSHGEGYRLCEVLDEATCKRLTGVH